MYFLVEGGNEFLNLSLHPGELQSKGTGFRTKCVQGMYKDFPRFCKDYNIFTSSIGTPQTPEARLPSVQKPPYGLNRSHHGTLASSTNLSAGRGTLCSSSKYSVSRSRQSSWKSANNEGVWIFKLTNDIILSRTLTPAKFNEQQELISILISDLT